MANNEVSFRQICRDVGVDDLQVNEVLRRVRAEVMGGAIVITHAIGTFERRDYKATSRVLKGITYPVAAKSCVQLRNSCGEFVEPKLELTITGPPDSSFFVTIGDDGRVVMNFRFQTETRSGRSTIDLFGIPKAYNPDDENWNIEGTVQVDPELPTNGFGDPSLHNETSLSDGSLNTVAIEEGNTGNAFASQSFETPILEGSIIQAEISGLLVFRIQFEADVMPAELQFRWNFENV